MQNTALLFAGQGAQVVGMGKDFAQRSDCKSALRACQFGACHGMGMGMGMGSAWAWGQSHLLTLRRLFQFRLCQTIGHIGPSAHLQSIGNPFQRHGRLPPQS